MYLSQPNPIPIPIPFPFLPNTLQTPLALLPLQHLLHFRPLHSRFLPLREGLWHIKTYHRRAHSCSFFSGEDISRVIPLYQFLGRKSWIRRGGEGGRKEEVLCGDGGIGGRLPCFGPFGLGRRGRKWGKGRRRGGGGGSLWWVNGGVLVGSTSEGGVSVLIGCRQSQS